jgi:uncharacterized membrane protein YfcA
MEIIFIAILTIVASAVGTVAGFGMSAIMISMLVLFLPFSIVLLLVGVIHWVASLWKALFFRKGRRPKITWSFGVPAAVGSFLGASLVFTFSAEILSMILGVFLVLYVLFLYFKPNFRIPRSRLNLFTGGALSGFFSGILGIGGSIRSAFLSAYNLPRSSYLMATGVTGLAIDTTRIATYISQGITLSPKLLLGVLVFIPATLFGTVIGKKMVMQVSENRFREVVALFLLIVGLRLIFFPT